MNKNQEIIKIKVNNGQELIAKAQEYKNSGGEWKLLERYWTLPTREKEKGWSRKNNLGGFIISNGKQKVDIFLEGHRKVLDLLIDDWDQMKAIFPEISRTCGNDSTPFAIPGKEISKGEETIFLGRMLVAWSVNDIFKIIADYCKENKAEIKKSVTSLGFENSLKQWIKVGNDTDGNVFIWVGKRDEKIIDIDGGGELQICINRKDLESYSSARQEWGGFVSWKDLDNSQLSHELFERIESFWYLLKGGRSKGTISVYDNHQVGFTQTPDSNLDLPDKETYFPIKDSKFPPKNNNSQLQNLKKIFIEHNIKKITFENNQLTIEYNNKQKTVNSQQFQKLEKYCKEHNEYEIDQQKLGINSNNTTNSEPNQGNYQLITGLSLGAGAVILGGVFVYFIRKRNKK